jgi:hypothetical protein
VIVETMVAQVAAWLEGAGLDQYINNFSSVSEPSFLQLMMQDYSRFGVIDMEHKTKLYRLIKMLNNEFAQLPRNHNNQPSNYARQPDRQPAVPTNGLEWQGRQIDPNADLLDLDAHDGDLLAHVRVAGMCWPCVTQCSNCFSCAGIIPHLSAEPGVRATKARGAGAACCTGRSRGG